MIFVGFWAFYTERVFKCRKLDFFSEWRVNPQKKCNFGL